MKVYLIYTVSNVQHLKYAGLREVESCRASKGLRFRQDKILLRSCSGSIEREMRGREKFNMFQILHGKTFMSTMVIESFEDRNSGGFNNLPLLTKFSLPPLILMFHSFNL